MHGLQDQVAVVTGASSGIGAALARHLSREGARVVLSARREDRLRQVATSCPGPTQVIRADVTLPSDREALVEAARSSWGGRIDILVNNAGLGAYAPFLNTDEAIWRRLFEVNLFAPVLLTRLVLPSMLEARRGLILNIASIAGLMAHAALVSPYVASKHALVGFSRALARDLEGTGVRVLAACPHLTDTEFFDSSPGSQQMVPLIQGLKPHMDTAEEVAQGILGQWESREVVIFPTSRPRKAYEREGRP